MIHLEQLIQRLKSNPAKYQCYSTFIEDNPFLGYSQIGDAFLFRGESDGPWVYFVCEDQESFNGLLPLLTPEDKQFALAEDYMLPALLSRGDLLNQMSCMRLILPDDVPLAFETPHHVLLRPLTAEDVPFMYANYIYQAVASIDYFENRVANGKSVGLVEEGKLVGWVVTHDDGALGLLHVLEDYRSKGYAEILTKKLCIDLRSHGLIPHLAIKPENKASMGLAKKIGFVEDRMIHWIQLK